MPNAEFARKGHFCDGHQRILPILRALLIGANGSQAISVVTGSVTSVWDNDGMRRDLGEFKSSRQGENRTRTPFVDGTTFWKEHAMTLTGRKARQLISDFGWEAARMQAAIYAERNRGPMRQWWEQVLNCISEEKTDGTPRRRRIVSLALAGR